MVDQHGPCPRCGQSSVESGPCGSCDREYTDCWGDEENEHAPVSWTRGVEPVEDMDTCPWCAGGEAQPRWMGCRICGIELPYRRREHARAEDSGAFYGGSRDVPDECPVCDPEVWSVGFAEQDAGRIVIFESA